MFKNVFSQRNNLLKPPEPGNPRSLTPFAEEPKKRSCPFDISGPTGLFQLATTIWNLRSLAFDMKSAFESRSLPLLLKNLIMFPGKNSIMPAGTLTRGRVMPEATMKHPDALAAFLQKSLSAPASQPPTQTTPPSHFGLSFPNTASQLSLVSPPAMPNSSPLVGCIWPWQLIATCIVPLGTASKRLSGGPPTISFFPASE